jgi:protein-disulfide isomerase
MSNQQAWSGAEDPSRVFAKLAASLGLDPNRFSQAMQSPELRQRIMNDVEAAKAAQVEATPTFFLNGRRIEWNPPTLEEFAAVIDRQSRDRAN